MCGLLGQVVRKGSTFDRLNNLSPWIMYIIQLTNMRYEPEHKKQTRDRIVRTAARKFRAEGINGPGVASVMQASGLTVGGFYKHFRNKDELLAEAIAQGFSDSSEKIYSFLQNVPR